jgi:geranylgeranyl reductase family protein
MARFDAIVVGAGPAGSTAARELAAAGARVLVVDRANFPRYKACGGGVPLRTERLLPFPIDPVVEDSVSRLDVAYHGEMRFVRDSGTPFAHMVMRDRFDALLLDHATRAGAEFRPATVVRSVERHAAVTVRAEARFEAEAEFLVCADGAHSPVGRMAGLGAGIAECAAWEVEVAAPRAQAAAYAGTSLIELGFQPWGYAWLFPKAGVLSIGIVLPRDHARTMKEQVKAYTRRLGLDGSDLRIERGHKIRFRRGHERIADGNVLLAGDAAGLADEFTEEGISYAVESGRLAARNVLRALASDGDLARYEADVDREVMPSLRARPYRAHVLRHVAAGAPAVDVRQRPRALPLERVLRGPEGRIYVRGGSGASAAALGPRRAHAGAPMTLEPPEIMARLATLYGRPQQVPHGDALAELVLTVLSQNTADTNSGRAFTQLMRRFPSWRAIAEAPLDNVIAAIQIGGLAQQKAPRIQAILRSVFERSPDGDLSFLEEMPLEEARAWLRALPGVGPKTAACVLLFALGRPAMPVDTHVERVSKRLGLIPQKTTAEQAHVQLEALVDGLCLHI